MNLPSGPTGALPVPEGYRIGAWRVDRLLGNGSFGSVYAARRALPRPGLPSRAALKFLPTGTRTPRQLRHLRDLADRETEVLSRVSASRLIRLYEILAVDEPGRPELDGSTVLVLEEADCSLDALLAEDRTPRSGPALLAQICEGLAQLHRAGWVHGDLKPGNVLLMPDGTARLADFNLAAELDGTHAYAPPFATPDYTPPDLLWAEIGERGRQIRPTADIWAFGVLAHLVLTGTLPLPGATPAARREAALRYARGEEELRISPRLPLLWRDIVHDCLARRPEDRARHSTASLHLRARTAAAGRRPRRPLLPVLHRHRRPLIAAAATGLLAGLLGLGIDRDPTGYARCGHGTVCFFAEPDGRGEMCAWVDGYEDWTQGGLACRWTADRPPRSVYNNGQSFEEGALLVDVRYYAGPDRQQFLGCVGRGERRNLGADERPRSHTWVPDC
ncbi:serine/threonine-protein kinase [Kitasatospora sp. NPDC056327]|uniref:serine/threonine-protein kinase n=1 Tax=Kitasatospora sp. NPDC056327 TaxID=3345785 RepID=UPI0035D63C96